MTFSDSLADSFEHLVNVQSIAATTRSVNGVHTSWGAVRAIYVREEPDIQTVVTASGETKVTNTRWMVQEEIFSTDRIWAADDASADPTGTPPASTAVAKPASIERFSRPGAETHWVVRF